MSGYRDYTATKRIELSVTPGGDLIYMVSNAYRAVVGTIIGTARNNEQAIRDLRAAGFNVQINSYQEEDGNG